MKSIIALLAVVGLVSVAQANDEHAAAPAAAEHTTAPADHHGAKKMKKAKKAAKKAEAEHKDAAPAASEPAHH